MFAPSFRHSKTATLGLLGLLVPLGLLGLQVRHHQTANWVPMGLHWVCWVCRHWVCWVCWSCWCWSWQCWCWSCWSRTCWSCWSCCRTRCWSESVVLVLLHRSAATQRCGSTKFRLCFVLSTKARTARAITSHNVFCHHDEFDFTSSATIEKDGYGNHKLDPVRSGPDGRTDGQTDKQPVRSGPVQLIDGRTDRHSHMSRAMM